MGSSDQLQVGHVHETGEISCPECADRIAANAELRTELAQLRQAEREHEIRLAGVEHERASLSYKLEELKRDKDAEAREHDLWDRGMDAFNLWRTLAGRAEGKKNPKGSKFTGDRFWLVLPFLKGEARLVQRAIVGRTFDHYIGERATGSKIHYHEWERIFGGLGKDTPRGNFEESCNRAPTDPEKGKVWQEIVEEAGFEVFE